jgi:arginase family enzyme
MRERILVLLELSGGCRVGRSNAKPCAPRKRKAHDVAIIDADRDGQQRGVTPDDERRSRQNDDGERELLGRLDVRVYTMSDVDRVGVEPVIRASLEHVGNGGFVHLSLDMDVVDPEVAPGVGTPVRGGFSYREAHLALELVAEAGLLGSLDVVEVNPIFDRENATGKLAVDLIASALGARIL